MSMTAYVSIGNSDDKLSQADWSSFCQNLEFIVVGVAERVYGIWYSLPDSKYQNMCIGAEFPTEPGRMAQVYRDLNSLREAYKQESIAFAIVDKTLFVGQSEGTE